MKKKLTIKFFEVILGTLGCTIIFCILSNLIINKIVADRDQYTSDRFYSSAFDAEECSEKLKLYLAYENGEFKIPVQITDFLQKKDVWLQILDDDNKEVYSSNRPSSLPTQYSTYELLEYATHSGMLNDSTLHTGSIIEQNEHYTFIVGYPTREYKILPIEISSGVRRRYIHTLILAVCCIAVGGYYCSHLVTKPLSKIIKNIKSLAAGQYIHGKEKMDPFYEEVNEAMERLSKNLARNEVESQQLEDKRGEWIANISHDLKAPLASIKGYSQLLTTGEYELMLDEIQKYGMVIEKNAVYMEELISDLSFIYKIRNRAVLMEIKTHNIIPIVQDIIINLLNNPKYENRTIDFEYLQEQVLLECDKRLITRAITNLLYNAIVHNPEETKISLKVLKKTTGVEIVITDNGKGIANEDIEALFNRYYRASNTSKNHGGSGLGMAISKEIIEVQGGEIQLESVIERGTTVFISFKK